MSNVNTCKKEFYLLLGLCEELGIDMHFGFPKYLDEKSGACLVYDGRKKNPTIYLPIRSQDHYSTKYNAVLLHEIGHYFVIEFGIKIPNINHQMFEIEELIEESLAWMVAFYLAKHLNLTIDKDFKMLFKTSINTYLDDIYDTFTNYVADIMAPLYKDMLYDGKQK